MSIEILSLNLMAPLLFESKPEAGEPDLIKPDKELLFVYELEESESRKLEADTKKLIKKQVFFSNIELPAGDYLFTQKKENLNMEEIIKLAVEMQAEGLWQRYKLDNYLYIRKLFEDGNIVTQLFRPCGKNIN